jgi:hypothetical protein
MSILKDNVVGLLKHSNTSIPIYMATTMCSIPLQTWLNRPVFSACGALLGGISLSIGESYFPDYLAPIIRVGCMGGAFLSVSSGIYNLCTKPIDFPAKPINLDIPEIETPSAMRVRFVATGYQNFYNESVPHTVVPNFDRETLLRCPLIRQSTSPEVIDAILQDMGKMEYEAIFFVGRTSGLLLVHLENYMPDRVASYNMQGIWHV